MKLLILPLSLTLVLTTTVLAATTIPENYKVIGSFIFGRHNDRQSKPATILTPIGATNQFTTGQFYRRRYFGIASNGTRDSTIDTIISGLNDEGIYVNGQIYCEAPSSSVILLSHYSFLQGLYPPIDDIAETDMVDETLAQLANGSVIENPLNGYQYVASYIQENATNDYIWIKGDENCPSLDSAVEMAMQQDQYLQYTNESSGFLSDLYSGHQFIREQFNEDEMTFTNAMSIYDEVYVNSIHNSTVSEDFSTATIATLKMWAERYQWLISDKQVNTNLTIGAQTLMARVVQKLNTTRTTGKPYLHYFTGSYNNMFQLSSVLDLTTQDERFFTMPEYGCTYIFELLQDTSNNDTFVQFSFKNGTYELGDEIESYSLFNTSSTLLPWDDFVINVVSFSKSSVNSWCDACGYDGYDPDYILDMCVPYSELYETAVELEEEGIELDEVEAKLKALEEELDNARNDDDYNDNDNDNNDDDDDDDDGLTLAGAGGIGAGVTMGVFAVIGGLLYLLIKMRKMKNTKSQPPMLPRVVNDYDLMSLSASVGTTGKHSDVASTTHSGATQSAFMH